MRAVWWRELRELFLPALALCVALGVIGAKLPQRGLWEGARTTIMTIGAGLGLFQGILDRHRRDDGFLLHRPISALRIHGVRSLAGVTVVVTGTLVAAMCALAQVWINERNNERMRGVLDRVGRPWSEDSPFTWGARYGNIVIDAWGASFGIALLFGGWALLRFAASRRRVPVAVFAAVAPAWGGWSLIARCPTVPYAAVMAMTLVVVVASLTLLDLSGDRR